MESGLTSFPVAGVMETWARGIGEDEWCVCVCVGGCKSDGDAGKVWSMCEAFLMGGNEYAAFLGWEEFIYGKGA